MKMLTGRQRRAEALANRQADMCSGPAASGSADSERPCRGTGVRSRAPRGPFTLRRPGCAGTPPGRVGRREPDGAPASPPGFDGGPTIRALRVARSRARR